MILGLWTAIVGDSFFSGVVLKLRLMATIPTVEIRKVPSSMGQALGFCYYATLGSASGSFHGIVVCAVIWLRPYFFSSKS